jgi:hypothetical protein
MRRKKTNSRTHSSVSYENARQYESTRYVKCESRDEGKLVKVGLVRRGTFEGSSRSLRTSCQVEDYYLSSGSHNRGCCNSGFNGLRLRGLSRSFCRNRTPGSRVLKRGDRSRLVNHGRILIDLGGGRDLRFRLLEKLTNSRRQAASEFAPALLLFLLL